MNTYIYIYIYVYVYVHMCKYIYICIHIYIHVCIHQRYVYTGCPEKNLRTYMPNDSPLLRLNMA